MQLLIVDNDPGRHNIIQEAANGISMDIKVSHIYDDSILMETLEVELPDMIYADYDIPVKDELEHLSQLHADKDHQSMPVIVCSVDYNEKFIGTSSEKKANFFLLRQSSFSTMIMLLKKLFLESRNRMSALSVQEFIIR